MQQQPDLIISSTLSPDTEQTSATDKAVAPAGFAGLAGIPGGTTGISACMASPVRRHLVNPKGSNNGSLASSIDTLDLGLFVTWENPETTLERLREMKLAAQATHVLQDRSIPGREHLHFSKCSKAPNYAFMQQFIEYFRFIASSEVHGKSPNVYISILSVTLWHEELSVIIDLIISDLADIGGIVERIMPSRVDLCADFLLDAPLDLSFIESHRVTRSRKHEAKKNGSQLETYYSGEPHSPIGLILYDKSKEIAHSNKYWLYQIWGVEPLVCVWRVEFRLKREVLRQFRIYSIDDLLESLAGIWTYLTTEWFSLRLQDNKKAERRTMHPWWQEVCDCADSFGNPCLIRRNYVSDETLPIQKIIPHVIGRMINIAAQSGIKDRKESIQRLAELLDQHCSESSFTTKLQEKRIKLGYQGKLGGQGDEV